tara:strand:+ start:468 stop:719 length:252 start_codon:yes stop_codon:yes gene_type:complete
VNVIKQIEKKIKNKINLEYINIIDNSKAHLNHKHFQKDKVHLILEIKSEYLKSLKRIDAERILMSSIKDELKNDIHALEIKLK